jgi:hypothetical protein
MLLEIVIAHDAIKKVQGGLDRNLDLFGRPSGKFQRFQKKGAAIIALLGTQ